MKRLMIWAEREVCCFFLLEKDRTKGTNSHDKCMYLAFLHLHAPIIDLAEQLASFDILNLMTSRNDEGSFIGVLVFNYTARVPSM